MLYIEDVEVLFTQDSDTSRPRFWRPRRFSPILILYSTILHPDYHGKGAITLIYGKYTDIGSIINAIIIKALQVYFSALVVQPFKFISFNNSSLFPRFLKLKCFLNSLNS